MELDGTPIDHGRLLDVLQLVELDNKSLKSKIYAVLCKSLLRCFTPFRG